MAPHSVFNIVEPPQPPPQTDEYKGYDYEKEQALLDKISALYAQLDDIRKEREEEEAQVKGIPPT
jgi:hypothetical protein